jgi:uncharacterized protein
MGFFGKFFVLAIVIAAVWYGWRWLQRVEDSGARRPRTPTPRRDQPPPSAPPRPVDDMQRCAVCGEYVSVNARRCARPTCPRG